MVASLDAAVHHQHQAIVTVVRMSAHALSYPFAEAPAGIARIEVVPGVSWLRFALPWSLNHINLWLLEDGEAYTVVDTGLGDPASRGTWTVLIEALDRPIRRIIVTHYHPDHIGNAEWLAGASHAPVWLAMGEYLLAHALHAQTSGFESSAMLAHFRRHGLDEERLAKMAARGNVYARGVPTLPVHYQRLLDGDVLAIGGRNWQAIAGQGHSPEHISLYCAQAGVLISGDMLLPRITTNIAVPATMPDEDSVGRFLASLRRFEPLPADTLVLPAHGLPFRGLHPRIGQLFAHHAERDATILEALRNPQSAADLLQPLFQRALDAHQLMFAMSETIAHLNHLWHRGLLRRIEEAGEPVRYQIVK